MNEQPIELQPGMLLYEPGNDMSELREDIDLMLAQQVGEQKYFREVKPETAQKMTELCIKEVHLDNERNNTQDTPDKGEGERGRI